MRIGFWCLIFVGVASSLSAGLRDLLQERVKCAVAVEFYVQSEVERRPTITGGLVIDREGTIIIAGTSIPTFLPPSELKDFKVYSPGGLVSDYVKAEYLGFDAASGWHFIRAERTAGREWTPVTDFVTKDGKAPDLGDEVWGFAFRGKDEEFRPVLLSQKIAYVTKLPQLTAVATGFVSGPQLPVFSADGSFVGLGQAGFGESFIQYSRTERGSQVLLLSPDETRVFRFASDVLPYLSRVPLNIFGRPNPWLGVMAVQPLPPDVAKFLQLENRSAVVVSEVLDEGPADKAGLKNRDIIVSLDGEPLPHLTPPRSVVAWLEREIALRKIGSKLALGVLRNGQKLDVTATLEEEPKILREADRKYFEKLGFTVREFLYIDAVANQVKQSESTGVVVHFVKSNSPAAAAGLRAEDWIREIDGVEIKTFAEAIQKLDTIEKDSSRSEFVMLISHGGETAVLRVKLK
ncbi:MAG TPA: PDZ domain-containing protein [Opitutaceae bacterium]|nr:PDZ domain-containing protein [Opitutaceae bacterium]